MRRVWPFISQNHYAANSAYNFPFFPPLGKGHSKKDHCKFKIANCKLKNEKFKKTSLVEETNPSIPGYSEGQIDPGTDRSSYGL
jgi:hypothetical protein